MTQISNLSSKKLPKRISTRHGGLTRILGGGFAPGSLVVLTGAPGIGKTTLALQILDWVACGRKLESVHFVTTEETKEGLALLAERIGFTTENTHRVERCTSLSEVLAAVTQYGAKLVVVDSLQGIGSPQALKSVCAKLKELACANEITIIATAHGRRDDGVPVSAAAYADVVLHMEHKDNMTIISTPKNRFGSSLASTMLPYAIRGGGLVKGFKRAMR